MYSILSLMIWTSDWEEYTLAHPPPHVWYQQSSSGEENYDHSIQAPASLCFETKCSELYFIAILKFYRAHCDCDFRWVWDGFSWRYQSHFFVTISDTIIVIIFMVIIIIFIITSTPIVIIMVKIFISATMSTHRESSCTEGRWSSRPRSTPSATWSFQHCPHPYSVHHNP